jgi:hypothetical protein
LKTSIGHIAQVQTGVFAKPAETGEVVYLQARHFDEHGSLLGELYPDLPSAEVSDKHLLKGGDVLFAAKGIKNFATVYESHNPPAVASTSFLVLRIQQQEILPEYLAWFLNLDDTMGKLRALAKGTAIPSITKADMMALEIPLIPMDRQQLIVRLQALGQREVQLRMAILQKRQQWINQQISNNLT